MKQNPFNCLTNLFLSPQSSASAQGKAQISLDSSPIECTFPRDQVACASPGRSRFFDSLENLQRAICRVRWRLPLFRAKDSLVSSEEFVEGPPAAGPCSLHVPQPCVFQLLLPTHRVWRASCSPCFYFRMFDGPEISGLWLLGKLCDVAQLLLRAP